MNDLVIKYPLPCGCTGRAYLSMCSRHQAEERAYHARALGVGQHLQDPPHCPTCKCANQRTAP